jgi:hypothetical protein
MTGYSVTPRWKCEAPVGSFVLISPTRSSLATLRHALSWSRTGRSATSVIIPTMTEPLLKIPRNLPTVAFDASAAALAGLRPTVTSAPLTARTRPMTLRFEGATGAAVVAGGGGAGAGPGGGASGCRSDGAAGCRVKVESIATPGSRKLRSCRGTASHRYKNHTRPTLEILLIQSVGVLAKYNFYV